MHPSFARCLFGCRFQSSPGNESTCVSVVSGRCLPSLGQHCCPDKANPSPWRETRHVLPVSSLEVGCLPFQTVPQETRGPACIGKTCKPPSYLCRPPEGKTLQPNGSLLAASLTDSFLLPFSYVSLEGVSVCWLYFKGRQKSAAD